MTFTLQLNAQEVSYLYRLFRCLSLTIVFLVQYSIPNATTHETGNQLGIFESLDVHYSKKDLDIYFSTLYP